MHPYARSPSYVWHEQSLCKTRSHCHLITGICLRHNIVKVVSQAITMQFTFLALIILIKHVKGIPCLLCHALLLDLGHSSKVAMPELLFTAVLGHQPEAQLP